MHCHNNGRCRPGARHRFTIAGLTLALILGAGAPLQAQADSPQPATPLGATLESVLGAARQISPELAIRALEVEAAQAKTMIAGSLPDPLFQIMSDDDRSAAGDRLNRMIYSFQQEIPLWGRRDLRRRAAEAEVGQMEALARNAEVELTARVKVAFARYYAAYQAVDRTRHLHQAIHDVAQVARARYGQGRGEQADVFRAEVDTTRVAAEIVRLEAELKISEGQLNALLLRDPDALLAVPEHPRSMPGGRALDVGRLLQRARAANPGLTADAAALGGAELNRKLAEKTWYPDLTLGVGAVQRPGWGPAGFQAWVGVKIPLQAGLHQGEIRQAAAQARAAQARLDARRQDIQSGLSEAVAGYQASQRTAELIRRQLLPQAEALVRAGTAGYAVDRVDLTGVLRSEHDLSDIRLQLLAADFDSQRQLAAIERLIGGDL